MKYKRKKKKYKKKILQSKFHGDAPVDLMTEFLTLVSSNQMEAALACCPKILKYEPDNILIKMYQETMEEAVRMAAQAKDDNGGIDEESSSSSGSSCESGEENDTDGDEAAVSETELGADIECIEGRYRAEPDSDAKSEAKYVDFASRDAKDGYK